jgi:hypothetical protein
VFTPPPPKPHIRPHRVACKHKQEQQTQDSFAAAWGRAVSEAKALLWRLDSSSSSGCGGGGSSEKEAAESAQQAVQVGVAVGGICFATPHTHTAAERGSGPRGACLQPLPVPPLSPRASLSRHRPVLPLQLTTRMASLLLSVVCHEPWACSLFLAPLEGGKERAGGGAAAQEQAGGPSSVADAGAAAAAAAEGGSELALGACDELVQRMGLSAEQVRRRISAPLKAALSRAALLWAGLSRSADE